MGLFDLLKKNDPVANLQALRKADASEVAPVDMDYLRRTLASAKSLKTDLVEVGDSGVCCARCAKYRNRIYTISGKDKRFPVLPKDFHFCCGLRTFPFVWDVMEPAFSCRDIIRHSNRPFVDDRTARQIEAHNKWKADMLAHKEKQKCRSSSGNSE